MEPGILVQPRETAMERLPIHDASRQTAEHGADHADDAAVARAQRDPTAFAPLYLAYVDPVYRYCYRRLGSREAAEDATSLVFERALRSLASFRGGSFRGWLFTIAHNAVIDQLRTRPQDPIEAQDRWALTQSQTSRASICKTAI